MVKNHVAFHEKGPPPKLETTNHGYHTRGKHASSTSPEEAVITEEPHVANHTATPEEQADVETILSMVPLPKSICERVHDIAKTISRQKNKSDSIALIKEWHNILGEDEADPSAILQDQEEYRDAYPTAFLTSDLNAVFAVHSIGIVALPDWNSPSHGRMCGFIGDVLTHDESEWIIPNVAELNPASWFKMIKDCQTAMVTACDKASKQADDDALLPPGSVTKISIPQTFRLPLTWTNYFLSDCTPRETYSYFATQTKEWNKSEDAKIAAKRAMAFARALLTKARDAPDDESPMPSLINLPEDDLTMIVPSGMLLEWASQRLLKTLQPRVTATKGANAVEDKEETPPMTQMPWNDFAEQVTDVLGRLVAMEAQRGAKRELAAKRAREEKHEAKDTSVNAIPQILLTPLLGFAGLTWEQREDLHPLFAQLHAAKTRKERHAILRAFFNDIAKFDRSFTGFQNTRLFDDICAFKFAPGLTAATAGEGVGILSFTPMDIHEVRAAKQEAEAYDEATVHTTADTRKKKASKAVLPPTNLSEFLSMGKRYAVFCEEVFSLKSEWTYDINDLFDKLERKQHVLQSDPATSVRLVRQAVWAITLEANNFFSQTCSKEDLERSRPKFATSNLSSHSGDFASGVSRELVGLPMEWKPQPKPPPAPPPRTNENRHRDETPGPNRNTRPRNGYENTDLWPVFKNSTELNDLKTRVRGITLTKICRATRIENSSILSRRAGIDNTKCMVFNVLGKCTHEGCKRNHTEKITAAQATAVYQLILPGIQNLLRPAGR